MANLIATDIIASNFTITLGRHALSLAIAMSNPLHDLRPYDLSSPIFMGPRLRKGVTYLVFQGSDILRLIDLQRQGHDVFASGKLAYILILDNHQDASRLSSTLSYNAHVIISPDGTIFKDRESRHKA